MVPKNELKENQHTSYFFYVKLQNLSQQVALLSTSSWTSLTLQCDLGCYCSVWNHQWQVQEWYGCLCLCCTLMLGTFALASCWDTIDFTTVAWWSSTANSVSLWDPFFINMFYFLKEKFFIMIHIIIINLPFAWHHITTWVEKKMIQYSCCMDIWPNFSALQTLHQGLACMR